MLPGHGVAHGLCFSTDGSTLVAADNAGHLRAWDPTSCRLRSTGAHPFRFPVMAVSPEGRWTAVGGWLANPGETDLTRVYDVATGHVEATLPGTSSPCDLAFSRDGQLLKAIIFRSVSKDVAVQTWKTATWRLASESVIPIEPEGVAYSARLFQDGSLLALVSRKKPGTVTLWDSATGQQTGVFQPGPDEPSSSIYGYCAEPRWSDLGGSLLAGTGHPLGYRYGAHAEDAPRSQGCNDLLPRRFHTRRSLPDRRGTQVGRWTPGLPVLSSGPFPRLTRGRTPDPGMGCLGCCCAVRFGRPLPNLPRLARLRERPSQSASRATSHSPPTAGRSRPLTAMVQSGSGRWGTTARQYHDGERYP